MDGEVFMIILVFNYNEKLEKSYMIREIELKFINLIQQN